MNSTRAIIEQHLTSKQYDKMNSSPMRNVSIMVSRRNLHKNDSTMMKTPSYMRKSPSSNLSINADIEDENPIV